MALFQQPVHPEGRMHVEFKAGRCDWDGRTITPDKRKGKVVLYTSEQEQLMHFQWHDREKGELVTDLIVVNDAYFEKIEKCTTGRVYILRFTSSTKKLFFWMQEPQEQGDWNIIHKFNEAVGATLPERRPWMRGGPGASARDADDSSVAGASLAGNGLHPEVQAALHAILQESNGGGGGGLGSTGAPAQASSLPLTAVLTPEVLQSLLDDGVAAAELAQHAPEGFHRTPEGLHAALGSPQLQQSLRGLTQAVHSDQLAVLFSSLGLNPGALVASPGENAVEVLCRAMEQDLREGPAGHDAAGDEN